MDFARGGWCACFAASELVGAARAGESAPSDESKVRQRDTTQAAPGTGQERTARGLAGLRPAASYLRLHHRHQRL